MFDISGSCEGWIVDDGATVVYCVTTTTGGGARSVGDGDAAAGGLADNLDNGVCTGVVMATSSDPCDGVGTGIGLCAVAEDGNTVVYRVLVTTTRLFVPIELVSVVDCTPSRGNVFELGVCGTGVAEEDGANELAMTELSTAVELRSGLAALAVRDTGLG